MSNNEYPEEGGATEKLDYLACLITGSSLKAECTEVRGSFSVSLKQARDGKLYASGFQISVPN